MSVNAKAYRRAAYPLSTEPEIATTSDARRFVLHWNLSKERDPKKRSCEWQMCGGTLYANGWVTLERGMNFETLGELENTLSACGDFRIDWIDA